MIQNATNPVVMIIKSLLERENSHPVGQTESLLWDHNELHWSPNTTLNLIESSCYTWDISGVFFAHPVTSLR